MSRKGRVRRNRRARYGSAQRKSERRPINSAVHEEVAERWNGVLCRAAGSRLAVVGAHQQNIVSSEVEALGQLGAKPGERAGMMRDVPANEPNVGDVADRAELDEMASLAVEITPIDRAAMPTFSLAVISRCGPPDPILAKPVSTVRRGDVLPLRGGSRGSMAGVQWSANAKLHRSVNGVITRCPVTAMSRRGSIVVQAALQISNASAASRRITAPPAADRRSPDSDRRADARPSAE